MIKSFRHRGLKRLYERGDRGKIRADHIDKVERIIARLDEAPHAAHMDLPGFKLHELKGNRAGTWAVWVSGNWRITFRFNNQGDATNVNYEDYH